MVNHSVLTNLTNRGQESTKPSADPTVPDEAWELAVEQVELATLEWVWWFNNQRLHSELDYRTPAEVEASHYAGLESTEMAIAVLEKH